MENELESLRSEVRSWKRKAESGNITMEGDHQLRTYKKKLKECFHWKRQEFAIQLIQEVRVLTLVSCLINLFR